MKLGTLVVEIGAETAGFVKGINETKTGLRGVSAQARTTVNNLGKIAVGAAAAGAALTAGIVVSSARAAKELSNLSRVAGSTPEEFQRMAFGARKLGVEQDKLSDILKDTKDRVGDFLSTGGGPMADFFENIAPKVGVAAQQFRDLSGPKALQLYVSSLERANVSQSEMTFYMEAMASDATALIPLLRDNGKMMAEQAREAERLGAVLSDLDVAKLEMMADEMSDSRQQLEVLGQKFSAELAPVLSAIAEQIRDMSADAGGFGNIAMEAVNGIVDVVGFLGNALRGIQVIVKGLELGFQGAALLMVSSWAKVGETIEDLIGGAIEQVNGLIEVANKLPKVQIDPIEMPKTPEFLKAIQGTRDELLSTVEQTKSELHDLMMEELPSDALDGMVERARAAMDKAAQAAVNAKQKAAGADSGGGGLTKEQQAEMDAEQAAKERRLQMLADENAQRQELLRERYFGEQEAQRVFWETMDEMELERQENKLISEEQFQQARLDHIRGFMQNQLGIQSSGYDAIGNVAAQHWNAETGIAIDALGSIVNAMAGNSRKMFEIQKAMGIANAVISTYTGAAKALELGWPLGPIAAAAVVANGFAKVSAIRAQSFGGGGGGGGSASGGGGVGAVNAQAQAGQGIGGQQQQQGTMFVSLANPSGMVSVDQMFDLINKGQEMGYRIQRAE